MKVFAYQQKKRLRLPKTRLTCGLPLTIQLFLNEKTDDYELEVNVDLRPGNQIALAHRLASDRLLWIPCISPG